MSTAIAIFVKTPGFSPLKTRLGAGIGEDKAHAFYRLSLNAIEAVVRSTDLVGYWAVGEAEALNEPIWGGFEAIYTGEGDLGKRQSHIYQTLLKRHDRVLLIGADAPQISRKILDEAVGVLDVDDYVIGPAFDGGYYLFGGRVRVLEDVWSNVTWSVDTTRTEFEERLNSKVQYLRFLNDVDDKDDLEKMVAEMPEATNDAQMAVVEWVKLHC